MSAAATGSRPAPDLRERRRERTRDELRAIALELFARHGYDAVTVDDVSAAAGVAPRTFFRYFPSKEDVLFGDRRALLQHVQDEFTARPADEAPFESVCHAVIALARHIQDQRGVFVVVQRVVAATPSLRDKGTDRQEMWESGLAQVVAERLGSDDPTDLRPRVIAGSVLAALRAAMATWREGGGEGDLVELTRTAFELLHDGGAGR